MDKMNFEEEIQDKEYFDDKIKDLEIRILKLENKAIVYGGWPDGEDDILEKIASNIEKYIEERETKNDK
jgi:hypothetical protein